MSFWFPPESLCVIVNCSLGQAAIDGKGPRRASIMIHDSFPSFPPESLKSFSIFMHCMAMTWDPLTNATHAAEEGDQYLLLDSFLEPRNSEHNFTHIFLLFCRFGFAAGNRQSP